MTEPDILVIGGGIAGASCALALARQGARVSLIEGEAAARWKIGETLGPESRPLLQTLGLWEEFARAGHLPCHGHASVWGWEGLTEKDLIFNPQGNGWQLDRVKFEQMLTAAAARAGVRNYHGEPVQTMVWAGGRWQVRLGERTISARWLIDATGRRALVARQAGVSRNILDQLVAIHGIAISRSGSDRDSRTFIESVPEGWWYSALMPGGRRTVSFQTDADFAAGQEWRTREWFARQLGQTRHIARLLEQHDYTFAVPPQLTSAHSGRLEQFTGEGWLAVGDAAMSFDPLSGHGMTHAMHSGIQAANAITGSVEVRASFALANEHLWAIFCQSRDHYYRVEKRFPGRSFWERRQR